MKRLDNSVDIFVSDRGNPPRYYSITESEFKRVKEIKRQHKLEGKPTNSILVSVLPVGLIKKENREEVFGVKDNNPILVPFDGVHTIPTNGI